MCGWRGFEETAGENPDQGNPAAFYLDLHARRPRVERVLDEFLHSGGRTLYYLAGGCAVGYLQRQYAYSASIRSLRLGDQARK
jgi:hypothetical protein